MNEVEFARPWLLAGLILGPLAFVGWAVAVRRAAGKMRAITRNPQGGPPYLAAALFASASMLAIIAAALPQWGTTQSRVPRNGADLVIVLDISRSMDVRDVQPSRLAAAKAAVAQTLARLGGDRVGLVVFAGSSRLRFPLTTDLDAATQVISSLESGTIIVEGGSNAALGLDLAIAAFDEGSATGRAVLLLTDGDDLGGDPAASAERFRRSGIDLLVAGVGTATGGPVPVIDPKTFRPADKLDASGQPIVSRLNETFLRALAAASGGRYLGSDLSIVPGAVAGRLQALKSAQVDERATTIPIERFQWFAGGALALLVLGSAAEWLSRRGRRVGLAAAGLTALLLIGGCATGAYSANEAGREALRRGDTALAIEKFIATSLWPVVGDATLLHQVLLNLCVNARDAMPGGGTLRLHAINLDVDASFARILPGVTPGPHVVLEVSDTGTGIDPEVVERIFDPFFTTKPVGQGTGLGLSTAHGIIKSHAGAIKVDTQPGKGATFQVYLPAMPEHAAVAPPAASPEEIPEGKGELILIVDDEMSVRSAAGIALEAFGYAVMLAADGAEALAAYETHSERIALVLTDLMMPLMDGMTLMRALRSMAPDLPIVASTGLGGKADGDELKSLKIVNILHKPYGAETLLRTIRQSLLSQSYLPPQAADVPAP